MEETKLYFYLHDSKTVEFIGKERKKVRRKANLAEIKHGTFTFKRNNFDLFCFGKVY